LPYTLEMLALTRLPARVFGVSMSMEPAIAALSGWMVLGEKLSAVHYLAIAAVMVASGGAAWSDRDSGSRS
jgi:inner membrane transporter RhtA